MKTLTTKECLEALAKGKTLQHKDNPDITVSMDMDGDIVDQHGNYNENPIRPNTWYLYTPPPQTITLTKDQIAHAFQEHILGGTGAAKIKDVDGFPHFLKALGFN